MPGGVRRGIPGLEIIDHVVDIDRAGLGQRLAIVRIDPEIADVRSIGPLDVRTELLIDGIGNDTVLNREGVGANGIDVVPLAELHGGVIENHVAAVTDIDTTRTAAAAALPGAQMPTDDVVLTG